MISCSRVVVRDYVSFSKTSRMLVCSHFRTWIVVSISSWQQSQKLEVQAPKIFIVFPVPQNQIETFIFPSLVPRGR